MLVEGIHFDLALTTWHDLGWKSLAVNLSDVAAMGAAPSFALVSIGLPGEVAVDDVEALYKGMHTLAAASGCVVAGGDTVATGGDVVINVALLGHVPMDEEATLLRRSAGQPGDLVAVTGVLGASAAGLYALQHPESAAPAVRDVLADAHRRPRPQLAAGQLLRKTGVRCAMDISDGLLADLGKLCAASGTGGVMGAAVRAQALPMHPAVVDAYPDRALAWAAGGGEDYQLLFCAPPPVMERALAGLAEAGTRATPIGELTAGSRVRLLGPGGEDQTPATRGWDHFTQG
jgi:thiamine-monophosphate kinase